MGGFKMIPKSGSLWVTLLYKGGRGQLCIENNMKDVIWFKPFNRETLYCDDAIDYIVSSGPLFSEKI